VGVADACSGIRSLTACLFAGSFLAAVFLDRFWKKILLLSMSAVLAFCMNVVRSLFLTSWAYKYGSDALDADFWGNTEYLRLKDAAGQLVTAKYTAGHAIPNPAFHLFTVHDFAGYSVLLLTLAGLLLLLPILNFKIKLPEEGVGGSSPDATPPSPIRAN
jgi:exosortase/archaeosortase family protein